MFIPLMRNLFDKGKAISQINVILKKITIPELHKYDQKWKKCRNGATRFQGRRKRGEKLGAVIMKNQF